jgi:glycosyltransferase involved in cell wall biosynthesis
MKAWEKLDLTVVAPSRWIAACARASQLFGHRPVRVLPNGIDSRVFRPIEREQARDILGISREARVVLFSAHNVGNPIKGFDLLVDALRALPRSHGPQGFELLLVGARRLPGGSSPGIPVKCLGGLSDDVALALANGAADLLVAPSREENLSNTVMEAMACGRPTVAFNVGGMPDLITDRVHGALAAPYDTRELRDAILWTVEDPLRWRALGAAARAKAESEYALPAHSARFEALYRELIERRSDRRSGVNAAEC